MRRARIRWSPPEESADDETDKLERIARLLEEIRDGQKLQLQDRSALLVGRVQRFMPIAMGVVVILILYVSWLLFRFYR